MPPFDLNNTFGAFFVGVVVSSALFGMTCCQIFHYFQNYASDSIYMKGVVLFLLIFEALHSALAVHAIYYYTILNYLNPNALTQATWSMILTIQISAIIMLIVHIFYATRVYYVGRNNVPLTVLIVALAISQCGLSFLVVIRAFQLKIFARFATDATVVVSSLVMAAAADTIITVSLLYYLRNNRSGVKSTDTLINKLMMIAINNGLVTSVFDSLVVLFMACEPHNLIYLSIFQVVGNLYTNSMMATLNSRKMLTQFIRPPASSFGSVQPTINFNAIPQTQMSMNVAVEDSTRNETKCCNIPVPDGADIV